MEQKYTLKTKLILPLALLTVILLLFGGYVIFDNYKKMTMLEMLDKKVSVSRQVAILVHSLQKERGLSSGFLQKDGNKFYSDLLRQRELTDKYLKQLFTTTTTTTTTTRVIDFEKLENIQNRIKQVRERINFRTICSKDAINAYSEFNHYLLEQIVKISKLSHVPIITQFLLADINLLYLKEYSGIERAEGIVLFSKKKHDREHFVHFTNLIAMQKQSEHMFLEYACDRIKKQYLNLRHSRIFQEVAHLESIILFNDLEKINIDPKDWYEVITKKLNVLDEISVAIEQNTKDKILEHLHEVRLIFYVVTLFVFVGLLIFIIAIKMFLELAKEEQRLRLVSQKYIISSITDLKGRIIDVSDAFCDISGYTREELIGKPHSIVRHPDMPKEVFRDLWETIKRGESWKGKVKNLKKDGGYYWVYANIEPLYDAKGNIDSYISIRLDITESEKLAEQVKKEEGKRKVAYEMMQQQARLAQMGEMLSMIAHQWRQPLSAITAATGVIQLKATLGKLDKETALELSGKIKEFSMHLSSTIDDFRGFFKSNKSKTATSFKKMTKEVLNIVKSSLESNEIQLQLDEISHKELETYEGEVKQVLLNLIKNSEDALKEVEHKRKIFIHIKDDTFTLWDNAGGIDEAIMPKIFDPYFSTKEKKDGTGLGLYMSKIIIEDHCKGSIAVENISFYDEQTQQEYKGAKFTIKLGDE